MQRQINERTPSVIETRRLLADIWGVDNHRIGSTTSSLLAFWYKHIGLNFRKFTSLTEYGFKVNLSVYVIWWQWAYRLFFGTDATSNPKDFDHFLAAVLFGWQIRHTYRDGHRWDQRGRLNIVMSSFQYRNLHVKDTMVSWPSYLLHRDPHTWESRSLYWNGAQIEQQ